MVCCLGAYWNYNWNHFGKILSFEENFPLLINKEPKKGLLSIDYSKLTSYLVKGLQETNSKVRDLEEKLKKEKDEREKMKEFFLEEIKKLRDEIKKE